MTETFPRRFLPVYALANAGGAIAYGPLLTLLLPMQIERIAPAVRLGLLSAVTIVGGIVASVAAIGFGMASDRGFLAGATRRRWIVGGLLATLATYLAIAVAATPVAIVAAVAAFQLAVNMMLAPLAAMVPDRIPDDRKGLAGGMIVLATPAALIVAVGVTAAELREGARLAIVGAVVSLCLLPLLLMRLPPRLPLPEGEDRRLRARDLARLSVGRLLVQIAGNALFTYLLFYFEALPADGGTTPLPARIARLTMVAFLIAAPVGLIVGRWSDGIGRRKPLLVATACLAAAGLAIMALQADRTSASIGFGIFALGSNVFLGLQTAFLMQVLPSPMTRGRDLGIVNLANTLPALVSSALAWGIVGAYGYGAFMAVLAALVVLGGLLTLTVRSQA